MFSSFTPFRTTYNMKLTSHELKELIREEVKIQTMDQVEREKQSKKISRDRRRSWDPDFFKLGRGITEDTSRDELIDYINQLKDQNKKLKDALKKKQEIDTENIKSFCGDNGFKSFKDYLQYTNAINSAEKGKLNTST